MSYLRAYRILLDGKEFIVGGDGRQLRITFNVTLGYAGYSGTGEVAIYNLSEASREMIQSGVKLRLEAGYVGAVGEVFMGQINGVLHERQGADVVVYAMMSTLTNKDARITRSYTTNTKVATVIKDCAAEAGYGLSWNEASFDDVPLLIGGYYIGDRSPIHVIKALAKQHGFEAAISEERIIITRKWADQGKDPLVIGEFTGMEMMPEVTASGIYVTTRLNPALYPGQLFEVDAQYMTFTMANAVVDMSNVAGRRAGTAIHTVRKIEHQGDSHGDSWSSKIEGIRQEVMAG